MMLDLRLDATSPPSTGAQRPPTRLSHFKEMIAAWRRRRRENQELLLLDERDLRDIRLSRSEALAMARRSLWR